MTRLELRELSVVRSGTRILDRVSVGVDRGEIVVVIGPNGAGKSTLLEAAIGAAPLATGLVLVDGQPMRSLGQRARCLGYLAGEAEPPAEARVSTLIEAAARPRGADARWRRELEERLGLEGLRSAPAGTLSRGERRRVLLFEALAASKPFLLLDEPTGVFDPLQLIDVVDLFRAAAGRGTGLLVTVHQMSDAETLAARLVILNRGRVVAAGGLVDLRRDAGLPTTARLEEVFLSLLRRPARQDLHAPA
jgi:ABC-type multidrug transport system ATPase subunit